MSSNSTEPYPMSSISSPHDNDILCGRGGVTHYHPGKNGKSRCELLSYKEEMEAVLKHENFSRVERGRDRALLNRNYPNIHNVMSNFELFSNYITISFTFDRKLNI